MPSAIEWEARLVAAGGQDLGSDPNNGALT